MLRFKLLPDRIIGIYAEIQTAHYDYHDNKPENEQRIKGFFMEILQDSF